MVERSAPVRKLSVLVMMLVLTLIPSLVEASPAILVVGNARNQIMTAREKEAIEILTRFRDKLGLDDAALPILSYHFNKADERAYCEATLGIKATHLLFVGLVDHEDRAARRVVSRINGVTDPYSACLQVMTGAARKLGRDPSALRTAVSTPTQSPTPSPTAKALSFLRIDVVNKSSEPQTRFGPSDAGVFFHVYFHNNHTTRSHRHNLTLQVLGPDGSVAFEPILGGAFEVVAGESTDEINLIKRADNDHATGYALSGKPIASRSGVYTVVATLDGVAVGRTSFEIRGGGEVSGTRGGVEIAEAYLIDYDGNRRDRFTTSDRGAYAVVFLRNTATGRSHTHTFRLLCFTPDAKPYGKPLGGTFTVSPGEDLSKKSLPRDIDPNQANGYRIKDNQMSETLGTYRFVIEIDGQAVKTLYFQVTR